MFDPVSANKVWPAPPTGVLRVSSEPDCCVSVLVSWRAPLGVEATSAKLARSAGIAPAMAFCATLRSRPRAEAIFAIMSGVRHCITREIKFVAMAILLSKGAVAYSGKSVQSGLRLQSLITLYYNLSGEAHERFPA